MFDAIADYFVYLGAVYAWCARHSWDQILMEYFGTLVLACILMGFMTIGGVKIYRLANGLDKDDDDSPSKSKGRTSSKQKRARSSETDEAGDVVDEMEEQRQSLANTDPLAAASAIPILLADDETPHDDAVYHEDSSRVTSDSDWADHAA
jgi:hypothetical protein